MTGGSRSVQTPSWN